MEEGGGGIYSEQEGRGRRRGTTYSDGRVGAVTVRAALAWYATSTASFTFVPEAQSVRLGLLRHLDEG